EFHLRSRMYARLYLNDRLLLESEPPKPKPPTADEIAAKEAADKKAREEGAQREAVRQAKEAMLRDQLEKANADANQGALKAVLAEFDKLNRSPERSDNKAPASIEDAVTLVTLEAGTYALRLEVTGPELDREVSVVYRKDKEQPLLVTSGNPVRFTEKAWAEWHDEDKARAEQVARALRQPRLNQWEAFWNNRHETLARKTNSQRKPAPNGID